MRFAPHAFLLLLSLVACEPRRSPAAESSADSSRSSASPVESATPWRADGGVRADADTTVATALAVLRGYYSALDARDYQAAYAAWDGDGPPGHPTRAAFAARRAATDSAHLELGTPGRVEGAAGSRYLSVPVTVRDFEHGGHETTYTGTYILRRTVVPGASPASERWHLYRAALSANSTGAPE